MKICFIYASSGKEHRQGMDAAIMPPLSIAVLAAYSGNNEITFIDERIESVPENPDFDIVGLSVNVTNVYRSYQIADNLRAAGITVVLGGYHVTLVPEESSGHADAIVMGHAESLWTKLLTDYENGRLEKQYGPGVLNSPDDIVMRRDIFKIENYKIPDTVEFARGCKFSCEFCSICKFNRYKMNCRRVDDVFNEIRLFKSKEFFFVDDNIYASPVQLMPLLERLGDLNLLWASQISLDSADDEEMLKTAAAGGCRMVMIGIESLNEKNLRLMGKKPNINRKQILESIKRINAQGIMVKCFFLMGYDYDTYDSVRETFDFVRDNNLLAEFFPLQPIPGTRLFERYNKLGIITKKDFWLDPEWKLGDVVYKPLHMSAEQLEMLREEALRNRTDSTGSL